MEMTSEPNYFMEVFRCCEDCKMHESCINVGHGCCSYKLYEKKETEMEMTIKDAILCLKGIKQYGSDTFTKRSQGDWQNSLDLAIGIMQKYQQLEDFARWVASEVIIEDLWEYNHLSFAELACRKLVKLGIMQEDNGKYLYEEAEEDGND